VRWQTDAITTRVEEIGRDLGMEIKCQWMLEEPREDDEPFEPYRVDQARWYVDGRMKAYVAFTGFDDSDAFDDDWVRLSLADLRRQVVQA
jgi:hypothetical protein